jgi:hypothetical protein
MVDQVSYISIELLSIEETIYLNINNQQLLYGKRQKDKAYEMEMR